MNLIKRLLVTLGVALATAGVLVGVPAATGGSTAQAVGVVSNYCYHPTYAPTGTNKPLVMAGPGFSVSVPCGSTKGNVYTVRGVNTAFWMVTSTGSRVCFNANYDARVPTNARVYSTARC